MIIAALVFEAGLCRDDPDKLLAMPIRRIMFWYDLAIGWRREVNSAQTKQRAEAERRARFLTR